ANDGRSVHVTLPKAETPIFRRRHPGLAGIALGAAVAMNPILGSAQGVLERAEGMLDQLKADIKGELQELREEVAYRLGMGSREYGYPLVLMDVTRQVLTAAPAPNSEGTEFNITIRNYWPKKEALDGTYKNPPIMRVP